MLGQDLLRLGQVPGRADDEDTVLQRQLDEIHDQLAIVEHQCAARLDFCCAHMAKRTTVCAAPVSLAQAPLRPAPERDRPLLVR